MSEKYIIDRFEGDYAVCETGSGGFVNIQKNLLPGGAAEGDVIAAEGEPRVYGIDTVETEARRNRIKEKMKKLRR